MRVRREIEDVFTTMGYEILVGTCRLVYLLARPTCPYCHVTLAEIVYGYPGSAHDDDEVSHGGCIVSGYSHDPTSQCRQ